MKKILPHILVLILLFSACSQPRKSEVIYRFYAKDKMTCVDSLRSALLDTDGLEMLVMYPDSDVVIIHYDRFRTHQNKIEAHFIKCNYCFELINKSPLKEIK